MDPFGWLWVWFSVLMVVIVIINICIRARMTRQIDEMRDRLETLLNQRQDHLQLQSQAQVLPGSQAQQLQAQQLPGPFQPMPLEPSP